ncbi:MAG: hypothetical protein ACREDQ_02685 [Limisphaerales bacterium]
MEKTEFVYATFIRTTPEKLWEALTHGEPWDKQCMIYPSNRGTPLVTAIFPGGHQFNPAAPALIVKFFKEHPGAPAEQAGASY